ncbi:MAG: glycosyltransferase family 39 protein [Hyphomicrobiaceae bacterium]
MTATIGPKQIALDSAGSRYGLLLVLVLGAILMVRLGALALNQTDLFFDEAQYWSWSRELDFGYFSKPPLIAWLIRAITSPCGDSAFCIRLASPIIHTGTALWIFFIAKRLYDPQAGFWSAIVFATLPGISFSSGLVSTDVPLLFFFAAALYAFVVFLERPTRLAALGLGVAIGCGLLAKYAMAYFVASAALYLLVTPERRRVLRDGNVYLALAVAIAFLVPNLLWNVEHGGVTFQHTAANAKWEGPLFHPEKALEFFGAQFGVFGPILFGALLVIAVRALRSGLDEPDRMLLLFSVPIIALITFQALLSRAHANWAAVAYVAASILVTATMLREGAKHWRRGSLALHGLLLGVIAIGNAWAGQFVLPGGSDPYARVLGWEQAMHGVEERLDRAAAERRPFAAILTDERAVTAELLYYLRHRDIAITAWRDGAVPHDHYELTRPFSRDTAEPVLLIHHKPKVAHITSRFGNVEPLGKITVPAGLVRKRRLFLYRLSGFDGRAPPGLDR